jgi:hypothetical protein
MARTDGKKGKKGKKGFLNPKLPSSRLQVAGEPSDSTVAVTLPSESPGSPLEQLVAPIEPVEIGDPGRAARLHVPKFDTRFPGVHDTVFDGYRIYPDHERNSPTLDVRAASVRGISHRHDGVVRQDSYCIGQSSQGRYLVVAVADGVSNASLSHLAAEQTVRSIVAGLAERIDDEHPDQIDWCAEFRTVVTQSWLGPLRDHLTSVVGDPTRRLLLERNPELPEDFDVVQLSDSELGAVMATTVIVAIIETADEDGAGHRVWLARVGDTSGWLLRRFDASATGQVAEGSAPEPEPAEKDDEVAAVMSIESSIETVIETEPEPVPQGRWSSLGSVKNDGEQIAESGTAALPSFHDRSVFTDLVRLDSGHALVLMTDGIGDPLGGGSGMVGDHIAELWSDPPAPLAFASHCDFARKSFDDDRTAVAIWPIRGPRG